MTALHQAAQKAVEALNHAAECVDPSELIWDEVVAATTALESALQQQPEPVAKPSRVGADGWRNLAESQAALLALQEVPREPVASNISWRCDTSGRGYRLLLNDRALTGGEAVALACGAQGAQQIGWARQTEHGILFERTVTAEQRPRFVPVYAAFAASPSTTQQQEAPRG